MERRIVAFDLETTGLDAEEDRIIEFCFVTLDDGFQEQARWVERVDPGIPVPPEASEVHGITDADLEGLPAFGAHAERARRLVDGSVLVAYNHAFDVDFLHHEFERAGLPGVPLDQQVIDPYEIFRANLPRSLSGAVRHYLGRELEGAHGAEADTVAMVDVLRAQRSRHFRPSDGLPALLHAPAVRYVERGRKLAQGDDGVVRFTFGKHRDQPVDDHPDYLLWMLQATANFPRATKRWIRAHMGKAHAAQLKAAEDTGRLPP